MNQLYELSNQRERHLQAEKLDDSSLILLAILTGHVTIEWEIPHVSFNLNMPHGRYESLVGDDGKPRLHKEIQWQLRHLISATNELGKIAERQMERRAKQSPLLYHTQGKRKPRKDKAPDQE